MNVPPPTSRRFWARAGVRMYYVAGGTFGDVTPAIGTRNHARQSVMSVWPAAFQFIRNPYRPEVHTARRQRHRVYIAGGTEGGESVRTPAESIVIYIAPIEMTRNYPV
jgi:hypothetical protein